MAKCTCQYEQAYGIFNLLWNYYELQGVTAIHTQQPGKQQV